MADIFREVDEEMRQHQMLSLWRKYGKYLVAAIIILVIAASAYAGWQSYWHDKREESSARFGQAMALMADHKTQKALEIFTELQSSGSSGYAYLAGLQAAKAELDLGHRDKAIEIYRGLAATPQKDPFLGDYAELLAVMQAMDTDQALDTDLQARLNALSQEGKPWAFTARQLQAVLAYRAGHPDEARKILTDLIEDVDAPPSVRERAKQLSAVIGDLK